MLDDVQMQKVLRLFSVNTTLMSNEALYGYRLALEDFSLEDVLAGAKIAVKDIDRQKLNPALLRQFVAFAKGDRLDREHRESLAQPDTGEDTPVPPEIKKAMALSHRLWDANLKLSRLKMPDAERAALEKQADSLRAQWLDIMSKFSREPVGCQSCFGSGWSKIETRHPMKKFEGMEVTAAAPCDCPLGRQYDRAYEASATRRKSRKLLGRGEKEFKDFQGSDR